MTTTRNIIVLIFISGIAFYCSNILLDGTLKNPINLGGELKSPPDSLYRWNIGKEAPFKYRILHRAIILGTYNVFDQQKNDNILFFNIYKSYALIFQLSAVILFYLLIGIVGLKDYSLIGAVLFALLPPMLLAYNVPVHTREDTLAYSILILGLIAIIKNKPILVLLISLVGISCRETMLIIPLIYALFTSNQTLLVRLVIPAVAIVLFVVIRLNLGLSGYDHAEGLRWNIHHPDQVIGFLFISFGFLWLPFLIVMLKRTTNIESMVLLYRSSPVVLLIIVVTTFLGGIYNEIRLLYLLAPWVITLSLFYYHEHQEEIRKRIINRKFIVFATLTAVLIIVLTSFLLKNYESILPSSKYGISYPKWIIATCIQLFLSLLVIPLLYQRRAH